MALLGDAYVAAGRVTDGMTLLDQVMAAVAAGEVRGVGTVGEIYCRLLSACERATDVRRAEQWLQAATHFEAWGDFVPPTCRTHYGAILISLGRWQEAERELLAAVRTFETGYWASQLFPLLRLAELRVRQGRFEEAERLLEGIDWHTSAKRSLATIALHVAIWLLPRILSACASRAPRLPIRIVLPSSACSSTCGWPAATWPPRKRHSASSRMSSRTTVRAPSPYLRRAGSEALEETTRPGPNSRRPSSCSRGSVFLWKPRGRESSSPGRSPRTHRPLQRWRRESHSRRSSVSARPVMRTRRRSAPGAWRSGSDLPEGIRHADEARDRSPVAPGGRMLERGDRGAPLHQPAHRRAPRRAHPLQARLTEPSRGCCVRAT